MNKTEIEKRFNVLLGLYPDKESRLWLTELKNGVLFNIERLEAENKTKQEIMDQQVNLIMEMSDK